MREARFGKRLLALVLTLALLVGVVPSGVLSLKATAATDEPIYVLAGSDFQPTDGKTATGVNLLNGILSQIQKDYPTMDGFMFAGDYDYNYTASTAGKLALQGAVQAIYGTGMHEVYVEGNHDDPNRSSNADLVTNGTLSPSGENDSDDYGVFVINHRDYMWYNSDKATIQKAAANLEAYLAEKEDEDYTKPIFIVSHLPLHYNMRTKNDGDGMYANYIFDVVNAAGEKGLNIIFLFGHNHSNGWDDYLGGAAVYLAKGDKINIAQASRTSFKEETLNFTYMNAGYTCYYRDVNDGSETDLTMTVFEITGSQVIVKRYSKDGVHDLKSKGVRNSYKSESGYDPDTTVYASPQYIKLVDNKTYSSNGVSVSAPGIEGVAVSVDKTNPDSEKYFAYITYDITPNKYIQGDVAEVTITLPEDAGFDASRPVVVLDVSQNKTATKSIVDGKVHFTTQHFSEYAVMQLAESATFTGDWIAIGGGGYIYELDTDGIDTGVEYLIVANSYAKALSAAANSNNAVDITLSADGTLAYADSQDYGWTFTRYSNGVYYIRLNGSTYLSLSNNSIGSSNSTGSSRRWTVSSNGDGSYDIVRNNYNLRWSNSNGRFQVSSSNEGPVRLYKYKGQGQPTYAQLSGIVEHEFITGRYASQTEVENVLRSYLTVMAGASDSSGTGASAVTDYTFSGTVNPAVAGTYTLDVMYQGVKLGEVTVQFVDKTITDTELVSYSGTVVKGAGNDAHTGAQILVTYDDGTSEFVDVTVGMLSGTMDVKTVGTYPGLTVKYNGEVITEDFTLYVVGHNDKPTYPNDGAVRVNKTATGIDFQASGIARVELSTAGVNAKKGVDVVIVIDTSSSMDNALDGKAPSGNEKSRIDILAESLEDMLLQFQKPDTTTGVVPDIDIAIISFNGFSTAIEGASVNNTNRNSNTDQSEVFTGTTGLISNVGLSVDNFVANTSLNAAQVAGQFNEDHTPSGTNYDAGLLNAYKLLSMKKEDNELNGESREQFLIFLSDGAPFRYNGFSHGTTGYDAWDQWLRGDWTDQNDFQADYPNNDFAYFYNGNGSNHPHRVAEAIKGDPNQEYTVVLDRSAGAPYTAQYQGLGATIYSIGFGLAEDGDGVGTTKGSVTVETMKNLMHVISSGKDYCVENVQSADELSSAFNQITGKIVNAATNARFVDQLGSAFDLVIQPTKYEVVENGQTVTKTHIPEITVKRYTLYTKADVEAGRATADMVGKRTGAVETLEVISFNETGTEAYSTVLSGNILKDGILCANTFWYNTTANGVAIEGVAIPQEDGTISNVLPGETFYWKVGTVNETELAISYDVYLTKTMEGERPAGSYGTNNYAILYYTNWLGNDIYQETTSPSVAWKSANVSYAFYLVNADGEIVVDPATGATGSFTNRVQVTVPVVFDEILLNNQDQIRAISVTNVATSILPEGYTLYDEAAEYYISIKSNGTGYWEIEKGAGKVNSTYVTGFKGDAYDNSLDMSEVGNDYTHTTVWFAVLWIPSTIPDAVVIDFGLPVDIHVLDNDQFGAKGQLAGIAPQGSKPTEDNVLYTEQLDSTFGTANVQGQYGVLSVNVANKTVRYTPTGTTMKAPEVFEYAVYYTLPDGTKGYYYGTVTIIPATTIYYEDTFLDLKSFTNNVEDTTSQWEQSTQSGTQAEDRPGFYSPEDIDKDNVYGYDGAYLNMSTYSMGSAAKITVSPTVRGEATFTFWGTGFDVFSMTSNATGTITVKVTDASGNTVKSTIVDTFYGYTHALANVTYTFTDGQWVRTVGTAAASGAVESVPTLPEEAEEGDKLTGVEYAWIVSANAPNAVYQVPVIKIFGLTYGQYTVKITAGYNDFFNHTATSGSYDLYLDAIRIYDPAYESEDANNAYIKDNEGWPVYEELRDNVISAEGVTVNAETGEVTFPADDKFMQGAIFIDSKDQNNSVSDYVNYGPNNELYLMPGQAVAFNVAIDQYAYTNDKGIPATNVANIQLGIKVGNGGSVTYQINGTEKTVSTTTDMYYSILEYAMNDSCKSRTVVIKNISGGILSLTNIKVTYKQAPAAPADGLLWISEETATFALMSLRSAPPAADDDEPEVTEPEATEPEVTEPEVTEPEATEPEVTEPEATEPEVTEPEVTEPEATEPEVTEPEATEPEVTEPEATEPEVTEPEATEPEATEPEVDEEPTEEEEPGFWDQLIGAIGGFFRKLFGWIFG